jgi:hypothetical protein
LNEPSQETVEARIESADRLISDGVRLNAETESLLNGFSRLAKLDEESSPFQSQRIASSAVTENVYQLYENLFQQYEQALAQYKQHRRDYYEHSQLYHNQPQPDMISPTDLVQSSSNSSNSGGMQALQFRAQDKCQQLQQLESTIIANEQRLQQMVSDLIVSQQKESVALFASAWADANQLAVKNGNLAAQFNHFGLLKTAQVANAVHDLIAEANRDGAYSAHMLAYKNLSDSNNAEQQINKRSNIHGQLAMRYLSQLASMRPVNAPVIAPSNPNQPTFSADQLEQENNALDQEYARVQDLFAKLESVRKSMPPSFNPKGIMK